jgi:hypothetical protein
MTLGYTMDTGNRRHRSVAARLADWSSLDAGVRRGARP